MDEFDQPFVCPKCVDMADAILFLKKSNFPEWVGTSRLANPDFTNSQWLLLSNFRWWI